MENKKRKIDDVVYDMVHNAVYLNEYVRDKIVKEVRGKIQITIQAPTWEEVTSKIRMALDNN